MQKVQKRNLRLLVLLAAVAVAVAGLMVVLSQLGGGGSQGTLAGIPQDGTKLALNDATGGRRRFGLGAHGLAAHGG